MPNKISKKSTKKTKLKNLIIVESPSKAKTLKKFLGNSYKIEASMGHIRDLPKSNLGVDIENDFEPKYINIRGKGDLISKLRKEVKTADKVYLATDPDREGEAISWHLMHALKLENAFRITFNEITKTAVSKSIKQARSIDMDLVDAQQARRVLDRIVGYKMSPILWKKIKKGLSAGRVQSVLLKIICDREDEIASFEKKEYWTIDAQLLFKKNILISRLHSYCDGKKIDLENEDSAILILEKLKDAKFEVVDVKKGVRRKKPYPPFTTSTLQQESSKLFGYTTAKIMQVAQQLYEGVDIKDEGTIGLVSYIRTDSVRISDEAYLDAAEYIEKTYGDAYKPDERRVYKSKARAQDAHEAIRPTNIKNIPDLIKDSLTKEQYKVYKLIWERFVASQMSDARYNSVSIKILANDYIFKLSGSILEFEGYLAVYKKNEDTKTDEQKLPEIEIGDILDLKQLIKEQHFTQPPARYTEAMIIKTLEELGIGRPSTYSPTITTVLQRGYVLKDNKVFYPTELGEIVNDMLVSNFDDVINIDFTAKMEDDLDRVEDGKIYWKDILRVFYDNFEQKIKIAEENIGEVVIEDEKTDKICEKCGKNMVIKMSKYGKFLACPGYPECVNAKPFFEDANTSCPKCKSKLFIKKTKKGRKYFGCENSEACDFMSWNKPVEKDCPICGEYLVEKGNKNIKLFCSNQTCSYVKEE